VNSVEVVRALISAGASVDARDSHGNTPLFRAVFSYRGDGAVMALLRDAGADLDAENASGVAPLSLARTIARCAAGQSSLSRSAEMTASSPPAVNAIAMKEFRKNRQRD
jgi:ankyrin repeat protein